MNDTAAQPKNGQIQKGKQQNRQEGLENFVFGKVQPQAVPLEEAVLGALMLDREALDIVADVLRMESFYTVTHQLIYTAIMRLSGRNDPVDLLTVTNELEKMGELKNAGGGYYLVELSNRVASAANIEYHARIISQKHIQRQIIEVSTKAIRSAYEDTVDVFDMLETIEEDLYKIRSVQSSAMLTMHALGVRYMNELQERSKCEGLLGVPSGISNLDKWIGGWQKKDLIIIAARPGMGKTGLALTFTLNAALDYGEPVAFFSLEMGEIQLFNRLVSSLAEVNSEHLNKGKLLDSEWQRVGQAIQRLQNSPIYIDPTPAISIMDLRARARRMKQKHGVKLIVVDYLQLMTATTESAQKVGNREQEVSAISRGLKGIAKTLDVPVIALSQLSRAVELRGGSKRPQLSDLRESGGIEADADIIGFIYRPEYYQIEEDEKGNSLKGVAEFIIAKNRNGALETVFTKFDAIYTRFSNLDPHSTDEMFPTSDPMPSIINKSRPVLRNFDTDGWMPERDDPPF